MYKTGEEHAKMLWLKVRVIPTNTDFYTFKRKYYAVKNMILTSMHYLGPENMVIFVILTSSHFVQINALKNTFM